MLFRWVDSLSLRWAEKVQQREMDDYLLKLRGIDGSELGSVAAVAAHMRNKMLCERGVDFLMPHAATAADPSLIFKLVGAIKEFQKRGKIGLINAAATMLWVHTIRAVNNPNLRSTAREMWGEIGRGFPYLEEGAELIEAMTRTTLDMREAGRYPDGFSPLPM